MLRLYVSTGGFRIQEIDAPEDLALSGFRHRVDFNLSSVLVFEDAVEVDEYIGSFVLCLSSLEAELLRDTESLFLAQTLLVVDWGGDDSIRVLRSDFLNIHTTLVRRDQNDALRYSVIENCDIIFVCGITAFRKHDLGERKFKGWTKSLEEYERHCRHDLLHQFVL